MRIDIGSEGKIVGTKRVGANGQVAGLSSLAGKDVLIVVPHGRPSFSFTARDHILEWQRMAQRSAKQAAKELRALPRRIPESKDVLALVRKELSPKRLRARIPDAAQARRLVERRLRDVRRRPDVKQAEKWVRSRWTRLEARLKPSGN